MSDFADRLHQARWDRDLSVRDAAEQAGVSASMWSAIENDRRAPGPAARPLLEAWLDESPQAFPPRKVDAALETLAKYRTALDDERVARLRTIVG